MSAVERSAGLVGLLAFLPVRREHPVDRGGVQDLELLELLAEDEADAGVVTALGPVGGVDRRVLFAFEVAVLALRVGTAGQIGHTEFVAGVLLDGLADGDDDLLGNVVDFGMITFDMTGGDEEAEDDVTGGRLLGLGVGRAALLSGRVEAGLDGREVAHGKSSFNRRVLLNVVILLTFRMSYIQLT